MFFVTKSPVEAVLGGRLKDELNGFKNEIRDEIKNVTPAPRQEININASEEGKKKDTLQEQLIAKIKERFPFLLPKGFNKGEVISVSSTSLPSEIKVKADTKEITLKITEKTIILRKFGGKSNLGEIKVGDIVTARGSWEDENGSVLITRVLRDLSIQKRKGTFWGKIKSIDFANKNFILNTASRGELKVFVQDGTEIVSRDQKKISLTDLQVGSRVRVTGVWDSTLNQISETMLIKDWSISPVPTGIKKEG